MAREANFNTGEIYNSMKTVRAEADNICAFIQSVKLEIVIGENGAGGKASDLKSMLESYKDLVLTKCSEQNLQSYVRTNLSLEFPEERDFDSWEGYYFGDAPLLIAASNLSLIQEKVRLIELEVLRELSSQSE